MADAISGARPRLVCRITPEALITGPKGRRKFRFDRGDNALFESSRGDRGFILHLLRNNFAAHLRKDFANGGYGIAAFH